MMLSQFDIQTIERTQMIDITWKIKEIVERNNLKEGLVVIHIPHTTAAVTINENADPDVQRDMTRFMDELVPQKGYFKHAEGNSDSHIKSSLFGVDQTIIVENGKMVLGVWQGIYFCEFDGPRHRKVYVKIVESD